MSTYGGGGASDIRSLSRQQIVTAVQEIKSNFKQAKFVMIVDQASIPILSSLFRTVELILEKIIDQKYPYNPQTCELTKEIYAEMGV